MINSSSTEQEWKDHIERKATSLARQGRFFHRKFGTYSIKPTIALYKPKVAPILIYAGETLINQQTMKWHLYEAIFWRKTLALPKSFPMPRIRFELALQSLESLIAWKQMDLFRKFISQDQIPSLEILKDKNYALHVTALNHWSSEIRKRMKDEQITEDMRIHRPQYAMQKIQRNDWIRTTAVQIEYKRFLKCAIESRALMNFQPT